MYKEISKTRWSHSRIGTQREGADGLGDDRQRRGPDGGDDARAQMSGQQRK